MAMSARKPSIDTCNACGKLFPRVSMRLCTGCSLIEEHRFQLVRDYLYENDGAPIGEIAVATGVSGTDVRRFQEVGRLVELGVTTTQCTCGGVGERCRACRARLSTSFRQLEKTMADDLRQSGESDTERTSYVRRIHRVGEQ